MFSRKFFLIVIFFAVTGLNAISAQEKLSFGLSTQLQNTRLLVNSSKMNVKGAYRPTAVLYTEYNLWRKMSAHLGFGYTMMTQNSDAFKNNFHYMAVPVYLKYGRLKDGKRIAYKAFIGANFHYLLNAEHVFLSGETASIEQYCRKFHWELTAGGGFEYKLSPKLSIEPLYSLSMGYMLTKNNPAFMDVHNMNTGFMLNLSYKLK